MPLTTYPLSRVRPVHDESSLERRGGAPVDWSSVAAATDGTKSIKGFTIVSRKADGSLQPRSYAVTLTSVVVASNVATATLNAHGFSVGDQVVISGASLAYVNGTKIITSVPTANTFTFAAVGADGTATGTINTSRTAIGIIETDANQNALSEAKTGYSVLVGGVLYETIMPDATGTPKTIPAALKAELTAAGCTFKYVQYVDSRAT